MLAKLKAFLVLAKTQLADIWNRSKMVILAIAGIIVTLEFRKLQEMWLVYTAKKGMQKTQQEDQDLATQEKNDNDQADALVKQANDLPNQQQPVGEDWFTKKDSK